MIPVSHRELDTVSVISLYGKDGRTLEHSTITGTGIVITVDHIPFTPEQAMKFTALIVGACQKFFQEIADDTKTK